MNARAQRAFLNDSQCLRLAREPVALLLIYRSAVLGGDTGPFAALAAALRARGIGVLPMAVSSLKEPQAAAVVRAIVELSHTMQLTVVAEGVETSEQLAALGSIGCDASQGYLIARPMPATAVTGYLASSTAAVLPG